MALIALPAFLGLMACLPVPIGNPEKSRIDPEILHFKGAFDEFAGIFGVPGAGIQPMHDEVIVV